MNQNIDVTNCTSTSTRQSEERITNKQEEQAFQRRLMCISDLQQIKARKYNDEASIHPRMSTALYSSSYNFKYTAVLTRQSATLVPVIIVTKNSGPLVFMCCIHRINPA